MKLNFFTILIVGSLLVLGCSNPMDTKITKENYHSLVEKIRKQGSEEEWKQVQAVQMLAKFSKKEEYALLEGQSFGEIIKKIKQAEKEKQLERLKTSQSEAEEARKEKERANKIAQTISIDWIEKNNIERKLKTLNMTIKKIELLIGVTNKSNQDIDAFEAQILVLDKLDNVIAHLSIKNTALISQGSKTEIARTFHESDFGRQGMKEVFAAKQEDLKFKFKFDKILFKNGTYL